MIAQAESEQFRMLSMMIDDTTRGMCIYQAATAREQQLIAYELKDTNNKKTIVIDMADYAEKVAEIPTDIQQFKKILDKTPEAKVVVVCNLQLCGLWMGDSAYIEKLNYMRDQMMECDKMWVFGMTPYFSILLSQKARDLYTYMMYNCSFVSTEDMETLSYDENKEYAGDIKLLVSQFEEYKGYISKQLETKELDVNMVFRTFNVWLKCADYLDCIAGEWIRTVMNVLEKSQSGLESKRNDISFYKLISRVYLQLGDYNKALEYIKTKLDLIKELFQPDSVEVAKAYEDMAFGYLKAENWDESKKCCQEALRIYRKLDKEYSLETINLWDYIARLYLKELNYDKAIDIHKTNIQTIMAKSNESHYGLLLAYNNMGRTYQEKGQISEALQCFQKSQELGKKYHSGNAESEIGILNNIANIYHSLGDLEKAKKSLIEAKKSSLRSFGEDNEATAHIYHNLAAVYCDLGQWIPAEKYYKKAIAIRKKVLGDVHTDLAKSYANLAGVYIQQSALENMLDAFICAKKALEIREAVYPQEHREVADSYAALARVCYKCDRVEDALAYMNKAQRIYIKLYGKNSQLVRDNEYNIELIKKEMNRRK